MQTSTGEWEIVHLYKDGVEQNPLLPTCSPRRHSPCGDVTYYDYVTERVARVTFWL